MENKKEPKLAIYWDFDNIHISVKNLDKKKKKIRYKQEPKVLDITAIMQFVASYLIYWMTSMTSHILRTFVL